jgi:DedD protein
MQTRPEAADPAVEELKRRARRRLVGAVVLALGAAVILPLLLESDPKPLGDDVSIQIPPIDNSKFVTRLPPAKGSDASAPGLPVTPTPKSAGAAPESRVETKPISPAPAPTPAPIAADTTEAKPADAPPAPAAVTPPADTAPPAGTGAGATNPDAPKASAPVKPAAASPAGSLVVQLAAFEDPKAASALSAKLKVAGYPAYIDMVKTSKGTMRRVRTGPYATREIADTEMGKLKTAGYRGVVTAK